MIKWHSIESFFDIVYGVTADAKKRIQERINLYVILTTDR